MNELWRLWAAKLDELTLRERSLVFLAMAGGVALLAYAAAFQPLLREKRAQMERINLAQTQLKAIDEELLKSAQRATQDPAAAKRERIRAQEAALKSAEERLEQRRAAEHLTSQQIPRLLRDVLGANRSLHVQALRVMPPVSLSQPAPPAAPGKPSSAARPPLGPFYRHTLEIEMTGTYFDLLKYVEDVEALPWRLAWSTVELKTLAYPQVQLRAELYTVSPSPTFFTF